MLRYIHTFIRFSWLFVIPLLVAPAVVALVMVGSSSYTATAALWVEQPLYLEQQRNTDGSFWDSPATQVAGQINELMSTRAFLTTVLESTETNATLKTEADRAAMLEYINKNFKVEASGWRLINLSYKDKEAKPALEVLESIVNKYKSYYDDRISRQGDGAIAYYQSRVKATKDALDQANKALEDFLAANPNKIGSEGATRAVRPEDLEFATLTQNRDAARKQYDDANAALEKVQASYGAYLQGQDTTLKIQDKPEVFSTSSGKARQAAMGAAIGFAVGVILAVLGTVALTLLDGTIRQPFHAQRTLGVGRVLELSNVNPVRGWYRWRKGRMLALLAQETKALPEGTALEGGNNKTKQAKVKPRFVLRQSFGEQIQVSQLQGEKI
jgi:tetratricopeptide (TPR) repeat protein